MHPFTIGTSQDKMHNQSQNQTSSQQARVNNVNVPSYIFEKFLIEILNICLNQIL